MRWPHLTEAEDAERQRLALAGWHEALVVPGRCTCVREAGDDGPHGRCAVCKEEDELEEEAGLATIGELNSKRGDAHGNRGDRISAAIGAAE